MEQQEGFRLLRSVTEDFGVEVTESQWQQFYAYMRLLQDWNGRMNLTAITEDAGVITKHFADSLTAAPLIREELSRLKRPGTLCDIGTGAGFPGIPLKIVFPELQVVLVDSLMKRLTFLDEVIKELGLSEVETVHMRAEDFGRDTLYRNSMDFAAARAVAPMNVILELCTPALKVGGLFIAMKGSRDEGPFENAAKKLSCKLENSRKLSLKTAEDDGSFTASSRVLYTFRKTAQTPNAYPRKAGMPSKNPL